MKNIENKVKRICDLYVNDWHLTTTLLPYINTQISKNTEIITILENGIIDNVKELLSKMNLNKATQDKILQIDWTSTIYKHSKIKNIIEEKQKIANKIEIIIKGSKEYIENANKGIEKLLQEINRNGSKSNKLL